MQTNTRKINTTFSFQRIEICYKTLGNFPFSQMTTYFFLFILRLNFHFILYAGAYVKRIHIGFYFLVIVSALKDAMHPLVAHRQGLVDTGT